MCTISTLFKSLFSQRAPDIRHPGRGEEQLRGVVPPVAAGCVPLHPLSHLQVPGLLTLIALITGLITRDKLIWQKLEFIHCHKNLGLNDQDRKIYGIICYYCHIGNYPPC